MVFIQMMKIPIYKTMLTVLCLAMGLLAPNLQAVGKVIMFPETLSLQGVTGERIGNRVNGLSDYTKTEVKLLRVIALRNAANDPFNDRTLPTAILNAQDRNNVVAVVAAPAPAAPAPPAGACPLNTTLTVLATLPSGFPLGHTVSLGTAAPYNLNTGGSFNTPISIAIVSLADLDQGTVSIGAGFTLISGSALGTMTEGANLTYLVRRDSDNFEFEVNFRFRVDTVFDSAGIVFETLTGRLCKSGVVL